MRKNLLRVRCAAAYAVSDAIRNINVDRDNLVIKNAVAMLANVEALGHGLMSDMTTLEQVADLGNQRKAGTLGRLGHPGISDNASGRQIMTSQNFRMAGERLLVDLHLFEPARRSPAFGNDPIEWMLDMAQAHPEHLALSAVVEAHPVWVLESGVEVEAGEGGYYEGDGRPDTATTPLPVMRVESLWALDVVVEGALTRGMFSANEASFYAAEFFDTIDEWRAQFNIPLDAVPAKVDQVLRKYLHSRGLKEPDMKKQKLEEKVVEPTKDEVLEASEEPATNPLVAKLDEAETKVQQLQEEMPEDEGEGEGEGEQSLEDAYARIAVLEEIVQSHEERIGALEAWKAEGGEMLERAVNLSAQLTEMVIALDRNVRRLEGDPVVTMNVPRTPGNVLEPLVSPKPLKQVALAHKPTHMTERERPTLDFDGNPDMATLQAALDRARQR